MLICKKGNLKFPLKLVFMSAMLVASSFDSSFAATGDILYQNCTTAGGCTGAGSAGGWTRTVETSGCYTGSCLKLVGTVNPYNTSIYGAGSTSLPASGVAGKTEITISQWVKYDEDVNSISSGNMKLDRAYTGGNLDFYATSITPSFGKDFYMGAMKGTMINKASWFDMVESSDNRDYPANNGDGTYDVNGYIKGSITSGGPQAPGTKWVRVTKYLRLPTTSGGNNGAVKVWIGDDLLFELTDAGYSTQYAGGTTFTSLNFFPSSEAGEPFEHWGDEMIVYEGYVPPSDNGASVPPVTNTLPSAVSGLQEEN
jgi:hypothetical protein